MGTFMIFSLKEKRITTWIQEQKKIIESYMLKLSDKKNPQFRQCREPLIRQHKKEWCSFVTYSCAVCLLTIVHLHHLINISLSNAVHILLIWDLRPSQSSLAFYFLASKGWVCYKAVPNVQPFFLLNTKYSLFLLNR